MIDLSRVPLWLKSTKQRSWLQQSSLVASKTGLGKSGKCLLSPGAGGAAALVGPSSLCSTTHSRHHTETTLVRHCFLCFLARQPHLPMQAVLARALIKVTVTVQVSWTLLSPLSGESVNTDTACVLGVWSHTCASSSVLLQVIFQLGFFHF